MISILIFLLGSDAEAEIAWGRVVDGRLAAHGAIANASGLVDFAESAGAAEFVAAVMQGEDVATRRLASPPKGASRLLAAARYLLEDELAESLDDLHVACAASTAGARVAAVRAQIIESWLGAFGAAGVALDALLVDYLALPSSAEGGTLVLRDGRAVAAFDGVGFAADAVLACGDRHQDFLGVDRRFAVLASAAQHLNLPFRARTENAGAADVPNLLLLYALAANDPACLNLLQGRFRRRTPWRAIAAPWRRAAMLAACAAAALFFAIVSDGAKHVRVAEKWVDAAKAVHVRAFPDVPPAEAVANARKRTAKGSDRTFSRVTSIVGKAAQEEDAVEVARIRYDAARAEYFVSVRSNADSEIEAFKNRLVADGVSAADNGGYRRVGAVWAGELIVRAQ